MKFLCVCEMGTVRSGAMAIALKGAGQTDTLACGWRAASPKTLKMLSQWADAIVVMERYMIDKMESKVAPFGFFDVRKILLVDVGPDVYGHPMHDGLLKYLCGVAEAWRQKNWDLMSADGHRLPLEKP